MLTPALAAASAVATVVLARRAWVLPVRSRIQPQRARTARRLPAVVRGPLGRALHDAQIATTPEEALGMWATGAAVVALLASAFNPVLAPAGILGVAVAGPVALALARGRGQRRFVAALPSFVELTAARLRSGHTVVTALADAGRGDGPVVPDVRRVLQRVELGDQLGQSLDRWAAERSLDPVRAVAGSFAVAADTGGAAAAALDGLARSLRDQLGARAEAASLSAQARMSALVVGLAPIGYVVFAAGADPHAATVLVTTPTGQACLALALVLDGLGAWWMRRIVRSEP